MNCCYTCSRNGDFLTRSDHFAKAEADRLTKLTAASARVPPGVRARPAAAADRVRLLAQWIGRATAVAAGHRLPAWLDRDARPSPRRPRHVHPRMPHGPLMRQNVLTQAAGSWRGDAPCAGAC